MADNREQYAICQQRGHIDSGRVLTSNPPWSVCAFCGTQYRWEQRLIEANRPGEYPSAAE